MSVTTPSWELFETFLAVMEGGSLSAASRTLQTAQPTIRRRIAALESALDATLFTRATNGLVPTEAAEAALVHARAMAASAQATARATSGGARDPRGTVRITASEIVGTELLPGVLAPLLDAWPEVRIELAVSNRVEDLLRRDADLAVRMGTPTQAALVAKKVGAVQVGLYAHRRYLDTRGTPRSVADLAQHRLVSGDRQRALDEVLAAKGAALAPRNVVFRTDDDVAQLAAVRAGVGLGVAQVALAARYPELQRVLPKVTVPLEMWVVMHEDLRAVRRVRIVFEHLVEALGAFVGEGRRARAS